MIVALQRVVSLLCLLCLASCEDYLKNPTFQEIPEQRTELIDGTPSYLSVSEARERFENRAAAWEVIEDSGQDSSSDSRPPFRIYVVRLRDFHHLGTSGELNLEFFNDRLMSTVFFPIDYKVYVQNLKPIYPGMPEEKRVQMQPFTEIIQGSDYLNRRYVSWTDIRLWDETRIWIARYS